MKQARFLALVAVAGSLVGGAPAAASSGVSIDVGSIEVREQLSPGGRYNLPTFGVRNPGTDETSYEIVVSYVDAEGALRPPEEWFNFDPPGLTLAAGQARAINTSLSIPGDAEPGRYGALIGPTIVGHDGGPAVGAGAAARVTFTVEPATPLEAWLRWFFGLLADHPWLLAVGGMLVLGTAVAALRRKWDITVTRRSR